ncbi:MAG: bifunctional riboflavin kinase/FAD synthetase [Timaviella obliquedivisa GSE-PSE-MK23-08B]|nr:bifunctional riboflavin kinase/FAD synthetase [Timaviella obliquedivisa GSE-PSE-MK23-08B]
MWIISSLTIAKTPTLVALGNFDGIHRGHRQVIQPILLDSKFSRPGSEKVFPTVVTFSPHPQEFFTGQCRTLLTPLDEKVQHLESLGIEQLVLLPFDEALANLTPQEFVEKILVQQLQVRQVSVGQNFRFGKCRAGTTDDLKAIAAQYNVTVSIAPLYTAAGDRVSSSAIRHALEQGKPRQVIQLLGRPYTLVGKVVPGRQLGRTIGFPTANLELPEEKFLPQKGVYRVRVKASTVESLGVMNIGDRPTVAGQGPPKPTVEVHLLNWSGDLYGQTLTVELENFLRPEQKFASLDDLKAQIQFDCQMARREWAQLAEEGDRPAALS